MLEELTQTYNGLDATTDILFIIVVTFILGYLARMIYETMIIRTIHTTLLRHQMKDKMGNPTSSETIQQEEPKKGGEVDSLQAEDVSHRPADQATLSGDNITQTTYTQMSTTSISHNENNGTGSEAHTLPQEHYVEAAPIVMPYKLNDLKMVEGVGPKIEQLLQEGGIDTWEKLAHTPAEDIKTLLRNAGERYRIHDPTTWPEQALLAVENKWAELEEYQGALSGGKDLTRIYKKTS